MTTETEQLGDLIRDLVATYVEHADELRLEGKEHPGAVYWTLSGHAEDYGKLVGKQGAHYEALRTLVAAFGQSRGELHVLNRFAEPEFVRRRPPAEPKTRTTYDPKPAVEMLERVLAEIVGEFRVEAHVRPNRDPRIPFALLATLTIFVRSEADYATLAAPPQFVSRENATLVAAIGQLFRARAVREGVAIQIDVSKP